MSQADEEQMINATKSHVKNELGTRSSAESSAAGTDAISEAALEQSASRLERQCPVVMVHTTPSDRGCDVMKTSHEKMIFSKP